MGPTNVFIHHELSSNNHNWIWKKDGRRGGDKLLVTKLPVQLNNRILFLSAEGTAFDVRSKVVGPAKTTTLSTAEETCGYHTASQLTKRKTGAEWLSKSNAANIEIHCTILANSTLQWHTTSNKHEMKIEDYFLITKKPSFITQSRGSIMYTLFNI